MLPGFFHSMNAIRYFGTFAVAAILGCGPPINRDELGTVVNEPPQFDRYDAKYPLPQLDSSETGENSAVGEADTPKSAESTSSSSTED
jgi:hypothetical protein